MAKNKGPIQIEGFIGGLSFYRRNGKYYLKSSSAPSKETIATDSRYANVRHSNKEFGGASKASKAVRDGMGEALNFITDKTINNRLTSLFKLFISSTEGEKGRRPVSFLGAKKRLKGFRFEPKKILRYALNKKISVTGTEMEVAWGTEVVLKSFKPGKNVTHARLFVVALTLSDLVFNEKANQYEPKNKAWHGKTIIDYTDYLPVNDPSTSVQKVFNMDVSAAEQVGDAVMICAGIAFYEFWNKEYSPAYSNCLEVIDVVGVGELEG